MSRFRGDNTRPWTTAIFPSPGGAPARGVRPLSFAEASARSRDAIPSTTLTTSRDVGWASLLVDHHRDIPCEEPFETHPTPDHTIVVMTKGEQEVASFAAGIWQRAVYRAGTVGLTPPGKVDRLRRRVRGRGPDAEKITLYIPSVLFDEVGEHYRRAGQRHSGLRLDALAFDDPLLAQTALGLLHAMRAGAPDFYAAAAAQWLALHLLSEHSPWLELRGGPRSIGALPDRRLDAVIEFMSLNISEPPSLQEMADEAGVSKFHFIRLFRKSTGTTPYAFLVRLRLQTARRLLVTTDEHMAEIARSCGFRGASQFSAAFSREYGMTPTAFRRLDR